MNKIPYEKREEIYMDALAAFGPDIQLVIALEELSEIQKEICKALRGGIRPAHLAEEIADATIMLEQTRNIFGINEAVCRMMDDKIIRLRQRIEKAKNAEETKKDYGRHHSPAAPAVEKPLF